MGRGARHTAFVPKQCLSLLLVRDRGHRSVGFHQAREAAVWALGPGRAVLGRWGDMTLSVDT